MNDKKRHDSIIPLSREHHYALLLCLRIHRGLIEHRDDADWLKKKASDAINFFASDLTLHFRAEEEVLFPAARTLTNTAQLVDDLLCEHQEIVRQVEQLSTLIDEPLSDALHSFPEPLADTLNSFADLLEAHIRKEERELFPAYERQISPQLDKEVSEKILNLIGPALKPKHPEFLE
jgi:hemerythrin-like domain-containing protein